MFIQFTQSNSKNFFTSTANNMKHLVFIDSQVADYQSLAAGVVPGTEVVILDRNGDGIEQITQALQAYQGTLGDRASEAPTVHIVSHGSPGCLYLGNSQLSLDTINTYASELQSWFSPHPTPHTLLLYGCNVAAGDAGAEFIAKLNKLAGAEIAASTTRTGNAAKGGDWKLEAKTAEIEADLAFVSETTESYAFVLPGGNPIGINSLDANYNNLPPDTSEDYSIQEIGADGEVFEHNYQVGDQNNLVLSGFEAGGINYNIAQVVEQVKINRVNNNNVSGTRDILWFERESFDETNNVIDLKPDAVSTMEEGLRSNVINRGADNVFANEGGTNINNVERIDFIASKGLSVPSENIDDVGFLILERGGNDQFKVAAITAIDANGNPTAFNDPVSISNTSTWGRTSTNLTTEVMYQDAGSDPNLRYSTSVGSQPVSGIFFSYGDLGITGDQTFYGYAVVAADAPTTGSGLLDLSNYPTNTGANSGAGGLDLVASGGVFVREGVNLSPPIIDLNSTADAFDSNRNSTAIFTEGDSPVSVADAANADVSDLSENDIISLTIAAASITNGDSEEVSIGNTSFPLGTDVTTAVPVTFGNTTFNITYDSSSGVFNIVNSNSPSSVMPEADLDLLVRSITYQNTSDNPTEGDRTLSFTVTDNQGLTSDSAVSTISVAAVNDPPILDLDENDSTATGADYQTTFTENEPAVAIADTDSLITDADDTNIETATVTLTNAQADDVLAVGTLPTGITASVDDSTPGQITVTLSGSAPLADYEAAIEAINFSNTSENPDLTDRNLEVVVSDGDSNSNTATSTISITPVNDPPVLDLDGNDNTAAGADYQTTFTENGPAVAIADADTLITDADDDNIESATVTLTNAFSGDDLLVNGTAVSNGNTGTVNGINYTVSANGNQIAIALTGSATKADYEAAIEAISFDTANNPDTTDRSVEVVVNDGDANSNVATSTIAINPVPTASDDTATVDEDSSVNINVTANDNFGGDGPSTGTITIETSPSSGTAVVNDNGTPNNPTDDTFDYTPNANFSGTDSFTYTITDANGDTSTGTVNITVDSINDPPVLDLDANDSTASGSAYQTTFIENSSPVAIADTDSLITDVDDDNIESATVTLTNAFSGDRLLVGGTAVSNGDTGTVNNINYTVSANGNQIAIALSGSATKADYEAAIEAISFENTDNNPDSTDRRVEVVVNDGEADSNTATTVVEITQSLIFQNSSLESGTDLQQGAVYRFPNVAPGVDALVEISALNNGATLDSIDVADTTNNANNAAFQPVVNHSGANTEPSVDFTFTFVSAGTTTPVTLANFSASAIDVDGNNNGSREFVELSDFSSYTLEQNTNLTATYDSATGVGRFEAQTDAVEPSINPEATQYVATAEYGTVTGFTYTAGVIHGANPNERQFSLNANANIIDNFAQPVTTVVSSAPDATDNAYTTNEEVTISGNIIGDDTGSGADSDPDNNTLSVLEVNGSTANVGSQITLASGGLLTVNSDGSFSYTPPAGFSDIETFTYTVSDRTDIDEATVTIDVNTPPVLDLDGNNSTATGSAYQTTFTENGPAVAIADADTLITDADDTNIESATVTLTNAQADDVLEVGDLPTGITANVDTSTSGQITVTLTGSAPLAEYQSAIEAISFENTSENPDLTDRNLEVVVNDGDTDSNVATSTISITPVNDPPVLDLDGNDSTATGADYQTTFTENGPAVIIADADTLITDADDTNIESATVTLTNAQADDVLAVGTLPAGISIDPDSTATNIILTGAASLAEYQSAIEAISFNNTSENPDLAARNVTVVVNDGTANSNVATTTISVIPVNNPPVVDLDNDPGGDNDAAYSTTYTEGDANPAGITDGNATITDPDDTSFVNLQLTVAGVEDGVDEVLALGGTEIPLDGSNNPATVTVGSNTYTVTLAGNVLTLTDNAGGEISDADAEAIVNAIGYENQSENPTSGDRTIEVTVNDGDTVSVVATSTVSVIPVNDPPVVNLDPNNSGGGANDAGFEATFTEGDTAVGVIDADADVSDPENNVTQLEIVVNNVNDGGAEIVTLGGQSFALNTDQTVTGVSVGGSTVDLTYVAATGTFTISDNGNVIPQADLDALVQGITYQNISEDPTEGNRTLSFTATDADGLTSDSAVSTVTVEAVNDPPVLDLDVNDSSGATGADYQTTFTEGDAAVNVADGLDADASDAENNITSLEIVVNNVSDGAAEEITLGGQTFALDTNQFLTVSVGGSSLDLAYVAETGTFAITNSAGSNATIPQAALDTLLQGITYENTSENPTEGDRTFTFTATDAEGLPSNTAVSTITVAAENDLPVVDLDSDPNGNNDAAYSTIYTEGDATPAGITDGNATITDPDDTSFVNLQLTIAGVADGANEVLTLGGTNISLNGNNTPATITVSNNTYAVNLAAEVLTLTNNDGGEILQADAEVLLNAIAYENQSDTPTPGDRTFEVTVNDGETNSVAATSTVSVNPVPDAVDDSFSLDRNTALIIASNALLSNDDQGDAPATVTEVDTNSTGGGTITANNNGTSYTYTPAANFTGSSDSFTYTITDANGDTSTATVNITIDNPTPDVIISDATAVEGNPLVFDVSLTEASTSDVILNLFTPTNIGTATGGADYETTNFEYRTDASSPWISANNGSEVTIEQGDTSIQVRIDSLPDTINEPNETFPLRVRNVVSGTVGNTSDTGTGTIVDNDGVSKIFIDDVTVLEGNNGTRNATFTVSLSNPSSQAVTVRYATANGTATAGEDYTGTNTPRTLTFAPGQTSRTITVPVRGDVQVEGNETFFVNLFQPSSNAILADNQGQGTIRTDDVAPNLTISDAIAAEGDGLVFDLSLSEASNSAIELDLSTTDGSATGGTDYETSNFEYSIDGGNAYVDAANGNRVTIPAGSTNIKVRIDSIDELGIPLTEPDETFTLAATPVNNGTVGNTSDTGEGTIVDNEGVPVVFIDDVTVTEGDDGTKNAIFTVSLSNASSPAAIIVDYATADGSATTADGDYFSQSGRLTFELDTVNNTVETSKTITVPINGDTDIEADETFFVNLAINALSPANAAFADNQGQGTIRTDDVAPNVIISDAIASEGEFLVFDLSLSEASNEAIELDLSTADGSATGGTDFETAGFEYSTDGGNTYVDAANGTIVTIPAGDTSIKVRISSTDDENNPLAEPNETFDLRVNSVVSGTVGDTSSLGTATIVDDEGVPAISISDATVIEGNNGTQLATFTVSLSNASSETVEVEYATANGTATAIANGNNGDYFSDSGTLNFAPGITSREVTVIVNGDTNIEKNETFFVNLSNPSSNATLADAQATGTIQNDDTGMSGYVFEDFDENGIQGFYERGVEGVTVTLIRGGTDGVLGTEDDDTIEITTDSSGLYQFADLAPEEQYQLAFGDLPAGANFTKANIGSDSLDSDVNAAGRTSIFTLGVGEVRNVDAGVIREDNRNGNRIYGTASPDALIGTPDDDLIAGFKGQDTLTGGLGSDTFFYNETSESLDIIEDFTTGEDNIDLTKILREEVGYSGADPFEDGYVKLADYGSVGTILQIDFDPNDSILPKDIVFLRGVSAANGNQLNPDTDLVF